jgi:phosphoglycolate phosphatase-like HAD superfamily hydrolase
MIYLFDIDGTILLTGGAGTRALNRVFRELYAIDDAMSVVHPAGMTDPVIVADIFAAFLGRAPTTVETQTVLDTYVPYLRDEVSNDRRFRLMPGAAETVTFLAGEAHVTLGIATGNIRAAAEIKLSRAGLWSAFRFGGFGDDHADRGHLVARAIERAKQLAAREVPPDRIVVVGDTPRDVAAARACGVQVIAVPTGSYDRSTLEATRPDTVLDSLWELPAWHRAR